MNITKEEVQQVLDALTDSVDLVQNEHSEAVELYGIYPTRHARIEGLAELARHHNAMITLLQSKLAEPDEEPMTAMVEMKNIVPPLRRSECHRLIHAALSAHPAPKQALTDWEILKLFNAVNNGDGGSAVFIRFARAIEARCK